jgi:threonine dehydratase
MDSIINIKDFQIAYTKIKPFIKKTKLIYYKNNIYLKQESKQYSGSFKWSGVLYAIINIFDKLLIHKTKPYYIVTQSTGNHGIATLKAINLMITYYKKKYSNESDIFDNIIPCIFTNKLIKIKKLNKMITELNKFNNKKGFIKQSFSNYKESLEARTEFLKTHNGIYVEHGGRDIILGYGAIAFEIDKQIPKNKTITFFTTIGAGGPIGIGLCLSYLRKINFYIVQPIGFDAFVRSLESGNLEVNKNNNKIIISDGIAVDKPEEYALNIAKKIVTKGIKVNIEEVIDLVNKTKLGNSSCIALSGINKIKSINSDYIVVLDCEGNS